MELWGPHRWDVVLPVGQAIEFPANCICCQAEHPSETLCYSHRASPWYSWFIPILWFLGKKMSVHAPVCPVCRGRLMTQRVIRMVVVYVFVFLGMIVGFWLFGAYQGPFRKWVVMGTALTCLIPYAFWSLIYPPTFDLTVSGDKVTYEFSNQTFAFAFARLNGGTVEDV